MGPRRVGSGLAKATRWGTGPSEPGVEPRFPRGAQAHVQTAWSSEGPGHEDATWAATVQTPRPRLGNPPGPPGLGCGGAKPGLSEWETESQRGGEHSRETRRLGCRKGPGRGRAGGDGAAPGAG